MTCTACHYVNEGDAQFCEQCGQTLDMLCPACGSQTKVGARFCRRCGQPLTFSPAVTCAAPPTRPLSLEELAEVGEWIVTYDSGEALLARMRAAV